MTTIEVAHLSEHDRLAVDPDLHAPHLSGVEVGTACIRS